MSSKSQPTFTRIIGGVQPQPGERPAISYPVVRRRVAHPAGLQVQAHHYPQGAIVGMPSDQAFVLEQSGHLQHGEPT